MNIFEILGPVMVGPSSSHTAGAVRIGYISRQLLGEPVKDATLGLYGSFWLTGSGHGTPLALIAGLEANVSGDYPTLIVSNTDVPGMVAKISALLAQAKVNIAEMRLYRSGRGKRAAFIAECDQEIPAATIAAIRALEGIKKVSYLSLEETPCRTIQ